MVVLLLLACGSTPTPEPPQPPSAEMVSVRASVEAYERGRAKLDAGDAVGALADFDSAQAARPGDALIEAWRAKAMADAGRLEEAISVVDALLAARPEFVDARYNRGAWRARMGDVGAAAVDFKILLDAEATTPRQLVRDADVRPHLGSPHLAFLPKAALAPTLTVPDKPPFMASEFDVELRVEGAVEGPVDVAGTVTGSVALVRVVEDDRARDDGDRDRVITWTFAVTGRESASISALSVTQGAETVSTEAVDVSFLVPDGVESSRSSCTLVAPSGVVGDRDVPSSWTAGTGTWVVAPTNQSVTTEPRIPKMQPWVLRRDGEPVQEIHGFEGAATSVTTRERGEVRWTDKPATGSAVAGCTNP